MSNKTYETARGTAKGFTLAGYRLDNGERYEFRFECRPRVAGGLMMDFVLATKGMSPEDIASDADKAKAGTAGLTQVMGVLEAAIQPVQLADFQAVIRDPEIAIELLTLVEIANDLAEEYAGSRPTTGPSSSGSSAPQSGLTSTPGSTSTAQVTYTRQEAPTQT